MSDEIKREETELENENRLKKDKTEFKVPINKFEIGNYYIVIVVA